MKNLFVRSVIGIAFTATAFASNSSNLGLKFSADRIIQNKKTNVVELIGNAKVTQGEKEVTGQKIILDLKTGSTKVDGDARFTAKSMTVNLATDTADKR